MARILYITIVICMFSLEATAQQWRVSSHIRESAEDTGTGQTVYEVYDSTHYAYDYSSNRGSSRMNDSIAYTERKNYVNLSRDLKVFDYEIQDTRSRTYNSDNTLYTASYINNQHDTLSWRTEEVDTLTYSNGQVVRHEHSKMKGPFSGNSYKMEPEYKYEYQYYNLPYGRAIESIKYRYANQYYPDSRAVRVYSLSDGRLIRDSTFRPGTGGTWLLNYGFQYKHLIGSNGKLVQTHKMHYVATKGRIDTLSRKVYTYDAQGVLLSDSVMVWVDTAYVNDSVHDYTYDAQGRILTDTLRLFSTNKLSGIISSAYTYTSFGAIHTIAYGNGGVNRPHEYTTRDRYNYELYWSVSTSTIASQNDELIAYPVPSSNFINLKWETAKPTTIHARIVNLQGRVVKQWSDDVEAAYNKSIYVGELSAGNYYIILDTGTNTYKCNIVIAK